jgi:hypothetical protein
VHDGYLVKPIDLGKLLETIGRLLRLEWVYEAALPQPGLAVRAAFSSAEIPARRHLDDLRHLGRIGYVRGIQAKLDEIASAHAGHAPFVSQMRLLVRDLKLNQYMAALDDLPGSDAKPT